MRVVIQRVKWAKVEVGGSIVGEIGRGFMILAGVRVGDKEEDVNYLAGKIAGLRVFDDENGVMNKAINDVGGEMLCISQFTLHALTRKGNRPSYINAAHREEAEPLYEALCKKLELLTGKAVKKGIFGADMQVSLLNDGPVTIIIDSQNKE